MTVAQLLQQAVERLRPISDTPLLDAQLLLSHLLDKPRSWLYAHDTDTIPETTEQTFLHLIRRRAEGEPVAYLTGWQAFYGLRLEVTPDVLIPRPETELLVELALEISEKGPFSGQSGDFSGREKIDPQNFRGTPFRRTEDGGLRSEKAAVHVVDLGTGSGAIAIALKHHCRHWRIAASELSEAALTVARENARRHKTAIDFRRGSWLTPFDGERFHLILSNPPYIDPDDPHLSGSIRFEPRSALVADDRGLADLAAIIKQAPAHLHPGGWLLLEHGFDQKEAVQTLLRQRGFAKVATFKDLAGHDRVSIGQWHN